MTTMLGRHKVLAAKIETTPGIAETLAASDAAFNIYSPLIQPNITMVQREGQGGFGYLTPVTGGHAGTATFRTMLEWDGTATEPSWADTFFPACGWVKSGQVYTPRSEPPGSNVKTLTIATYQKTPTGTATIKKLAGCAGSFVVTLPTGTPGYIDWTFTGVPQDETDDTLITPTYPTDKALRFAGGLAEWNDVNLCVSQATINSGNSVILRECPTTESGYISAIVTDRRPTISVDPEAATVAAQARWAAWLASTEYALELDIGGPGNSVLSFDAPKAVLLNRQEAIRNGIVVDQIEFQSDKNGATHDQELSITFTAAT